MFVFVCLLLLGFFEGFLKLLLFKKNSILFYFILFVWVFLGGKWGLGVVVLVRFCVRVCVCARACE